MGRVKLTAIYTKRFRTPLKHPFITALRRVASLEDVVVVIESDQGVVGYGEGAPTPQITGETLGSIEATIAFLAPLLIGKEIDEKARYDESFDQLLETIHQRIKGNTTAKAALEIALYDLKAKALRLPLYRMLGGTKQHFRTDITISLNPIAQMVQDAQKAIAEGYTTLKVKIGTSVEEDAQRIEVLYHTLPKTVTLRLDANQGWSAQESVALLQRIERQGIIAECIEQPVPAEDIKGLQYIKARVQTPLLADESVFGYHDAQRLLEMQAVDYINIKLAKTGGISRALQLADLCHTYDTQCMIGCMLEGPIAIAAGVHLASAKADTISMIDLDAVSLLAKQPLKTQIRFEHDHIVLSETEGLGISL